MQCRFNQMSFNPFYDTILMQSIKHGVFHLYVVGCWFQAYVFFVIMILFCFVLISKAVDRDAVANVEGNHERHKSCAWFTLSSNWVDFLLYSIVQKLPNKKFSNFYCILVITMPKKKLHNFLTTLGLFIGCETIKKSVSTLKSFKKSVKWVVL